MIFFHFSITLKSKYLNKKKKGELSLEIDTVDKVPLGATYLVESLKPGKYNEAIEIDASPDPQCDPMQGFLIFMSLFLLSIFLK